MIRSENSTSDFIRAKHEDFIGQHMSMVSWCTNPFAASNSRPFAFWLNLARTKLNQEYDTIVPSCFYVPSEPCSGFTPHLCNSHCTDVVV